MRLILTVLLLALVSACSRPGSSGPSWDFSIVETQVPAGMLGPALPSRASFDARYPEGSRVVLASPEGDGFAFRRVVSRGLAAAGAPSVSFDGRSVVFAGKAPGGRWAVYEAGLEKPSPRKVFGAEGRDCGDPAYLPNGKVAFVCTVLGGESKGARAVYTSSLRGEKAGPITFGGASFDPWPLRDGRLVFSRRQSAGAGRPAGGAALFSVNPDGTLLDAFFGSHDGPRRKERPRETFDGGLVFVSADRAGRAPRLERVEMRWPMGTRRTVGVRVEEGGSLYVGAAEPLKDGGMLLTGSPAGELGGTWDVYFSSGPADPRTARSGLMSVRVVHESADWDVVEAVPASARPVPAARPAPLKKPEGPRATLICYEADRTDGVIGPRRDGPKAASARVERMTPPGAEVIDIQTDGSFQLDVPADTPLRVATLDSRGAAISASGWFWLRPGEVRACFGCHEPRRAAPRNKVVEALLRVPTPVFASNAEDGT